jgi:hypothetical protein
VSDIAQGDGGPMANPAALSGLRLQAFHVPARHTVHNHSQGVNMTDKHTQSMAEQSNMEKDPDDWVTGDEPMTGAQRSYLKTLSEEAKVEFEETLTKAEASKRIDELQEKTGRGQPAHG